MMTRAHKSTREDGCSRCLHLTGMSAGLDAKSGKRNGPTRTTETAILVHECTPMNAAGTGQYSGGHSLPLLVDAAGQRILQR